MRTWLVVVMMVAIVTGAVSAQNVEHKKIYLKGSFDASCPRGVLLDSQFEGVIFIEGEEATELNDNTGFCYPTRKVDETEDYENLLFQDTEGEVFQLIPWPPLMVEGYGVNTSYPIMKYGDGDDGCIYLMDDSGEDVRLKLWDVDFPDSRVVKLGQHTTFCHVHYAQVTWAEDFTIDSWHEVISAREEEDLEWNVTVLNGNLLVKVTFPLIEGAESYIIQIDGITHPFGDIDVEDGCDIVEKTTIHCTLYTYPVGPGKHLFAVVAISEEGVSLSSNYSRLKVMDLPEK